MFVLPSADDRDDRFTLLFDDSKSEAASSAPFPSSLFCLPRADASDDTLKQVWESSKIDDDALGRLPLESFILSNADRRSDDSPTLDDGETSLFEDSTIVEKTKSLYWEDSKLDFNKLTSCTLLEFRALSEYANDDPSISYGGEYWFFESSKLKIDVCVAILLSGVILPCADASDDLLVLDDGKRSFVDDEPEGRGFLDDPLSETAADDADIGLRLVTVSFEISAL